MNQSLRSLCALLLSVLLFLASANNVPKVQRIPAKFDFSPPSRASIGSSNITIAIVKPRFVDKAGQHGEYYVPPFDEMSASMANDFEELLTAKGFTVRGPFGSRDEMVFNDKKNSDFVLEIEIDLNPLINRRLKTTGFDLLSNPSYKVYGEISFGGYLQITAASPRWGEKVWKKNIALDRMDFNYEGSLSWIDVPPFANELVRDNQVYNSVKSELEIFYDKAMNLMWKQIDINDMQLVSEEAKRAEAEEDKRNAKKN